MKGLYINKPLKLLLLAIFLLILLTLFIAPAVSASIAGDVNNDGRIDA